MGKGNKERCFCGLQEVADFMEDPRYGLPRHFAMSGVIYQLQEVEELGQFAMVVEPPPNAKARSAAVLKYRPVGGTTESFVGRPGQIHVVIEVRRKRINVTDVYTACGR